jgi:hypothetical protein
LFSLSVSRFDKSEEILVNPVFVGRARAAPTRLRVTAVATLKTDTHALTNLPESFVGPDSARPDA